MNNNNTNRIDPTASPVRMSSNLSVDRQTPKSDFGDRVKAGLDGAASAVANGAAVAAPFVPGGAIVSAAVSGVSNMSSGGGVSSQYSAVSSVPTPVGGGVINTTVTPGSASAGSVIPGSSTGSPSTLPTNADPGAPAGNEIMALHQESEKLLSVQIAMQRENQVFSTVSNVLKVRHDTIKNTIQNVH